MVATLSVFLSLFSVLLPQKMWFAPSQPINVTVKSDKDVTLVLTDFAGKPVEAKGTEDVTAGNTVDIKAVYPAVAEPGTYILYARPKGAAAMAGAPKDFLGTPLVIEVLKDRRPQAPQETMVVHVEPLRYVKMTTSAGPITMIFYYDVAPHTVDNFLDLSAEGYFDGLTFHRIVPSFVIQGGDPVGNGSGGPGYEIAEEFNDRPHLAGALSMARSSDPNSAGSQFFICLDYGKTQQLDKKYTVFGTVVEGFDTTVAKIAATPLGGPEKQTPITPQVIEKAEVMNVTADKNPYAGAALGAPAKP